MIQRTESRIVPNLSNYIQVDIGERGPHDLRVPDAMAGLDALRDIGTDKIGALTALANPSPGVLLALLESAGVEVLGALCYLVGIGWRHTDWDLETDTRRTNQRSTIEIGRDVLMELEDQGYSLADIIGLGAELVNAWVERNAEGAAAVKRADFLSPSMDSESCEKSTSTSETVPTSGNGVPS